MPSAAAAAAAAARSDGRTALLRAARARLISWLAETSTIQQGLEEISAAANEDEVNLDDEMEKVFRGSGGLEIRRLSTDTGVPHHLDSDYDLRRRGQGGRGIRPGAPGGLGSSHTSEPDFDEGEDGEDGVGVPLQHPPQLYRPVVADDDDDPPTASNAEPLFSSESEPQVSERAASYPDTPFDSPNERRVQFPNQGDKQDTSTLHTGEPPMEPTGHDDDRRTRRKARMHHHHMKGRKHSLQEEPRWRQHRGSDASSGTPYVGGRRVSIQPEDESLAEADLEQLDSHRSDDPRGLRRPKIQPKLSAGGSTVYISRKDAGDKAQNFPLSALRKMQDHRPHSLFIQMNELYGHPGTADQEWKETARWIKYEENVEEGSDRWGKPHVSSLSFHSLLNLRRCLESGVILLDLDEKDLPGAAYRITEQMTIEDLITEDDKALVMRSILIRHRHPVEHEGRFRRFSIASRKHASYTSLQTLFADDQLNGGARCSICSAEGATAIAAVAPLNSSQIPTPTASLPPTLPSPLSRPIAVCRRHSSHVLSLTEQERSRGRLASSVGFESISKNGSAGDMKGKIVSSDPSHRIDMKEETYTASTEDVRQTHNENILKRVPEGAEAAIVLVGSVNFLEQPTIAFVRLNQAVNMPTLTEVLLPVRFMFVLMGPDSAELDYREIGRSISTLLSIPTFQANAYKAEKRSEILSAINDFLDDSIVLPPGNWERQALLSFDELKTKSNMIRHRKQSAILKKSGITNLPMSIEEEQKKALLDADSLPPKKPPNPLERTGKPFGGVINDMKRRYPHYISDLKDGLNGQCFAAAIFMYFAALSSSVTFGGLYGDKTNNLIGISETLLSTAIAGVLFAVVSGQPLMVVGSTGPLLLFDQSLFAACQMMDYDYLACRVYMGLWMLVIAVVVSAFEGSVLVKKFTRFTEDIFASLISLIFIVEAVSSMIAVFRYHPLLANYCNINLLFNYITSVTTATPFYDGNSTEISNITESFSTMDKNITAEVEPASEIVRNQPNTALFCSILTLGTFTIAYYLRIFRNGHFLGRSARRALGDFGVPIAIILMVALDALVPQTYTEKLKVPVGLSPSSNERGWIISFSGIGDNAPPAWVPFALVLPALMVYIIIFMETHIAELIVDKPERNLKKGSGFHMDIVVLSVVNVLCGFLGAPWQCVATVRSVSHVSALTVMSTTHAPGDKPHIIEVKEQRLSAFIVSLLVGISVAMASLLRMVPVSVLFGVFLYMGISSTNGIQLFDRLILLTMPVKHHPELAYVKRVPTWKMHMFTVIQIVCLALLWTVKSTAISLAFPFFLILMVPLRGQLHYLFTPMELHALDGKNQEKEDEPDFYEEAPLPG